MRIVIDNNVILDALLERQPFCDTAQRILMACANTHVGCLSANSLTDIFYVLRKLLGAADAKKTVKKMILLFEIIPVDKGDCVDALSLPFDDFEDSLILMCAEKIGADYVVTRDNGFLQLNASTEIVSPDKLLSLLTDSSI